MFACTATDQDWLRGRWLALTSALASGRAAADAAWDSLVQRYQEPHRAYHNLSHIMALLRVAKVQHCHIERPEVVELAIWFHDVIYDTHQTDNELRSAAWAREAMRSMGIVPELITAVEQCILATQQHEVPPQHAPDLPIFLDLDLAILGAPPELYLRYSQAIRAEYSWVNEDDYRKGRADVLRRFLARPALYFTPPMVERYEAAARHNIEQELSTLDR